MSNIKLRVCMSKKGLRFLTLLLIYILFCSNFSYASKTTDLMSAALKQRAKGNISAAIKGFKQAVDEAPTLLQKNLALFMLGDCQMEASKYDEAVVSFGELSKKATTANERAEALYKLMEAYSNLGKYEEVDRAYSELKKKYPQSAYREIADAFMKAEEIMDSDYSGSIVLEDKQEQEIKQEQAKVDVKVKKETSKADSKNKKSDTKASSKESAKPVKADEAKPNKTEVAKQSNKTNENQKTSISGKKLDSKTTAILEDILSVEKVSDSERDNLVSKILSYQDKLKDGEKGRGKDKVLFELAGATAKFGELLEACKTYDKILSLHPTSTYVETAYYQSIRLRAILGVHQAVIDWSKAFNSTFPNSKYKKEIAALVSYSQAGGNVQLSKRNASAKSASNTKKESGKTSSVKAEDADAALKASSMYKKATEKMNEGKYSAALDDLKVLASKYSNSPQLWWDTTLVYVQLEEFKEADKSIRKMLLLDPNNSDANSLLGYIQYRLENYDEAASAYEQAGESEGEGVTFFDAKTASERMKKNSSH